jgi:hypothetical protein
MKPTRKVMVTLGVASLALVPAASFAQARQARPERRAAPQGEPAQVRVQPFHFGLGALATWARDAGEPTSAPVGDREQFGLLLQKLTATSSFSASGAVLLDGAMSAESLTALGFEISGFEGMPFGTANAYCNAGAPRINVFSNAPTACFLGCAHGQKTQHPVTGWWTISFTPPFTQYPGCEAGVSGTITFIELVFDEGTDLGPGSVVVDDIRVNNQVFGGPPRISGR